MRSRWIPAVLALGLGGFAAVSSLVPTASAEAGSTVTMLVLREHGVGTAAQAQPYVDKLVAAAAKVQGWSSAKGVYQTDRASAKSFIASDHPQYGILSLGAYLGLHDSESLEAIGQVSSSRVGGQQYFIVSKSAKDLDGCKGATLATNHSDDTNFIDKVVSGGAFSLSSFTVQAKPRPLQPIKAVINDEAKCALIDDAQYAQLKDVDGGSSLSAVWTGPKLPAMVVVAFPNASDKSSFKGNLSSVCSGDGKTACDEVGISSLSSASESDYSSLLSAYR
ncbi:MAG: hypothetical protein U0414_32205 [Polyangiaceae bacterium]